MPLKNMDAFRTSIVVRTRFTGFHAWSDAPDDVAFLRFLHRHEFHVEARLPVTHDDRELEFFLVKNKLQEAIGLLSSLDVGARVGSCEMIARFVARAMALRYQRSVEVSVFEDGENGAIVLEEYAGASPSDIEP